jgi:hypothetical protein
VLRGRWRGFSEPRQSQPYYEYAPGRKALLVGLGVPHHGSREPVPMEDQETTRANLLGWTFLLKIKQTTSVPNAGGLRVMVVFVRRALGRAGRVRTAREEEAIGAQLHLRLL